jgi:hypothetical protein
MDFNDWAETGKLEGLEATLSMGKLGEPSTRAPVLSWWVQSGGNDIQTLYNLL